MILFVKSANGCEPSIFRVDIVSFNTRTADFECNVAIGRHSDLTALLVNHTTQILKCRRETK